MFTNSGSASNRSRDGQARMGHPVFPPACHRQSQQSLLEQCGLLRRVAVRQLNHAASGKPIGQGEAGERRGAEPEGATFVPAGRCRAASVDAAERRRHGPGVDGDTARRGGGRGRAAPHSASAYGFAPLHSRKARQRNGAGRAAARSDNQGCRSAFGFGRPSLSSIHRFGESAAIDGHTLPPGHGASVVGRRHREQASALLAFTPIHSSRKANTVAMYLQATRVLKKSPGQNAGRRKFFLNGAAQTVKPQLDRQSRSIDSGRHLRRPPAPKWGAGGAGKLRSYRIAGSG